MATRNRPGSSRASNSPPGSGPTKAKPAPPPDQCGGVGSGLRDWRPPHPGENSRSPYNGSRRVEARFPESLSCSVPNALTRTTTSMLSARSAAFRCGAADPLLPRQPLRRHLRRPLLPRQPLRRHLHCPLLPRQPLRRHLRCPLLPGPGRRQSTQASGSGFWRHCWIPYWPVSFGWLSSSRPRF